MSYICYHFTKYKKKDQQLQSFSLSFERNLLLNVYFTAIIYDDIKLVRTFIQSYTLKN